MVVHNFCWFCSWYWSCASVLFVSSTKMSPSNYCNLLHLPQKSSIYLDPLCCGVTGSDIQECVREICVFDDIYLISNGRIVQDSDVLYGGTTVQYVERIRGGKGGFGSMLRAIGAQIEKTTNREACRDLSGRRLRDINEEKRLKNWIALQADREREAAERRKKKMERLCAEPKHEFKDKDYEKDRAELADKVSEAVEQGFKLSAAGGSGVAQKRKAPTSTVTSDPKKKKSCLWIDVDEDELSSSTDDEDCSSPAKTIMEKHRSDTSGPSGSPEKKSVASTSAASTSAASTSAACVE